MRPSRARRWTLAAVALAGAAGAIGSVATVVVQGDPSTGVSRIERAAGTPWRAFYSTGGMVRSRTEMSPVCVGAIPFRTTFTTPAERDRVDITVSATLEYRTSPRDGVRFAARLQEPTTGNMPAPLKPREYRLAPSTRPTTTTLVWIAKSVPAAGRTYSLSVLADAACRVMGRSFATGNRTTVVIESWSAGD